MGKHSWNRFNGPWDFNADTIIVITLKTNNVRSRTYYGTLRRIKDSEAIFGSDFDLEKSKERASSKNHTFFLHEVIQRLFEE